MSNCPLTITDKARNDILLAAKWYEQRQTGLGIVFVEHVNVILESIGENPCLYPIAYRSLRRALLHRFPYAVFYLAQEDGISVVAVLHCKRAPEQLDIR